MTKLLYISVSPMGEGSISRPIADEFIKGFESAKPGLGVISRDLAANPVHHLDGETIMAGYVSTDQMTESQKNKHNFRMELVEELKNAEHILVSTPMWNYNVPSVLKAYIDQIVVPGVLYGSSEVDSLKAKSITLVVAQGGSYKDGPRKGWDYETGYLQQLFGSLGGKNIEIILSEFGLAGVLPGMESFVEQKKESIAAATKAAFDRGINIGKNS